MYRDRAPWWAALLVTMALLGLTTRLLVSREHVAVAGAIIGYVGSYWLPSTFDRRPADGEPERTL